MESGFLVSKNNRQQMIVIVFELSLLQKIISI